ncbi:MAG TPA: class I SAM-dependent methyltransferase [Pilimelia sp.]|nr:class I SAM-dependent methyltransferase [Pilimelia sp.]
MGHDPAGRGRGARLVTAGREIVRATRHDLLAITGNLARAAMHNGREAAVELSEALVQKWERTRPPCRYTVDADWESRMHDMVGAPWPCPEAPVFAAVFDEVVSVLRERGITVGPDSFVGWSDADPATSRAVWCLTRHLRPSTAVETGVARGLTTRIILEAMERNRHGRLWSVDLPPQLRPHLNHEIAAAVPYARRGRWTMIEGSSRHRLGPLLSRLRTVELFVHDSRHTTRNLRFELTQAWRHLRVGGVAVADDIDLNHGLPAFRAATTGHRVLIAAAELPDPNRCDGRGLFAVIGRPDS